MVEPPLGSAEVAEQADASVSKTDVRKDVRVRLPLSAPRRYQTAPAAYRVTETLCRRDGKVSSLWPAPPDIAVSPRERVLELARQMGECEAADWCAGVLDGSIAFDDPRQPPIAWLGGRHAAALQLMHGAAWG